jgi:hypothetical protein
MFIFLLVLALKLNYDLYIINLNDYLKFKIFKKIIFLITRIIPIKSLSLPFLEKKDLTTPLSITITATSNG